MYLTYCIISVSMNTKLLYAPYVQEYGPMFYALGNLPDVWNKHLQTQVTCNRSTIFGPPNPDP